MRFIETAKLNDFINETFSDPARASMKGLYGEIEEREIASLQKESLESDSAYLKEVSSLLNAVVSIIYHPHIANKTEEVILRVEQVGSVGPDEFRQILMDTKLWKRHGAEMIPEEVHYRQYIDELRIYENQFIVMLIDMMDRELARYNSFYVSKLPTFDSRSASLPKDDVGGIIVTIDRLRRRIQFIKGTYFYKVVSEGKKLSGKITPTNILTKDRLYRHCFRFYRSFIRYEDTDSIKADLCTYYVLLLLRAIKLRGFELVTGEEGDEVLSFKNNTFDLTLEIRPDNAVRMTVGTGGESASHLLYFSLDDREDGVREGDGAYTTVESLSLWGLTMTDRKECERVCASEKNLVRTWIDSKLRIVKLDHDIYSRYCPVCRGRSIEHSEENCICRSCASEYAFINNSQIGNVWFRNIRK